MKTVFCTAIAVVLASMSAGIAQAEETEVTFRLIGLFAPEREADLKKAMEAVPDVALVNVDFKTAEARFKFDAAKAFPGTKPDKYQERIDNLVRTATNNTFSVKPVSTMPRDKLTFVEIPVVGLDCKACSLACYETVAKLEGVEQATASFKEGLVTAWIDPAKTDKAKLEAALKQRGVQLKQPPEEKKEEKKS